MIQRLDIFHKSPLGHLLFGVAEGLLAYLFVSLAINSGSLWEYFLAIIFFLGLIRNFIRIVVRKK